MPRPAWLLPGRRQALLVSALILVAGASLLLLPDRSSSYRAVATATAVRDAPPCLQDAPNRVGDEDLRERVASRSRVSRRDVAGAIDVLPAPAGAVLSVAFEADTAYAAQRGAYSTVLLSISDACADDTGAILLDVARADDRLDAAEEALRAATTVAAPAPPPTPFVTERDEAAAAVSTARASFDEMSELGTRSTSVGTAEALGSERSALEDLAVPGGVVLCALLALVVLRTGWRRAARPVPA
jgi:hypothetical protein